MLKLNYFNGRGMAETSRLILAAAGAEYEDFRYPLEIIDWSTYNFVRKEFDEDKASGKLWRSMGKVPFLEVDGKVISQSKAIERYLAGRFGLMGANGDQAGLVDSYCEYIRDFKTAYQRSKKSENKEEALEKWFGETLPEKLKMFNDLILKNNDFQNMMDENPDFNNYSVNDRLSLADIVIYSFLVDFFDNKEGVTNAYKDCEMLKNIVKMVGENPGVKAHVENRPETSY